LKTQTNKLTRLSEARRRLRDLAAGEQALADAARARAVAAHRSAEHHLDRELDGAMTRLADVYDIRELIHFADGVRHAREHVAHAAATAAAATAAAESRVVALRGRARELKVAERLLDRQRAAVSRAEQRREQLLTDERAVVREVEA
jgi:hypothetical protein